ncbi:KDP operon transcriptional regulatory protein KdpE [Planctomycetes bacterium Pan216]|uniref:KDP operon transcriptional regulatory protein KdpE n=1 Tax=Kolteria novifilia TaxID=2527975 RepID=A0A518B721_9BACT|nr:KDP operon transcriptional regulatory protein KdpE [Planctomycetes bacterium Pan216]
MAHAKPMICFVEDSDIDFEMALLATRRVRPDAEVRRCVTFHDAVRTLGDADLSLIVLDMNLPDGNGLEVLRHLRNLGMREEVSVVVFSTSANPNDREGALQAGANEYVQKPSRTEVFLEAVGTFVERWA